jgi:hypothetical protein
MDYKWSYSSLGLFQQCPKKYFHLRVAKDVKEPETEALTYGKQVHEAAEFYIKDGTPIPEKFAFIKTSLDLLKQVGEGGTFLCEYKMGLTRNLEPCEFFANDVWWRGVADLIILKGDKAFLVDYKTGKSSRFADTKQLEILSLAMFKHFPEVKEIKAGLLFLVAEDLVKISYETSAQPTRWVKWLNDTKQLEAAYENGVWNPKPNFSCKQYCAVTSCIYNGKNH